MIKFKYIWVLLLFTFVSVLYSKDVTSQLPKAPKGFIWLALDEIDGAILKPQNWYYKKELDEKGTIAYFVTKEEIKGSSGQFETGYSLNVLKGISKKTGKKPSVYAANLIQDLTEKGKYKNKGQKKVNQYFEIFQITILIEDGSDKYISAYLITANDTTDTIYISLFESPAEKWENEKNVGLQILNYQAFEEKY